MFYSVLTNISVYLLFCLFSLTSFVLSIVNHCLAKCQGMKWAMDSSEAFVSKIRQKKILVGWSNLSFAFLYSLDGTHLRKLAVVPNHCFAEH
jgi:hypothetical protein